MRVLIQKVNSAKVIVDKKIVGDIENGILIYVGFSSDFNEDKLNWIVNKILSLKIFEDDKNENRWDRNILDIKGEILVISNFTLFGGVKSGTKINFNKAQKPDIAKENYNKFIDILKEKSNLKVKSGIFGARMLVDANVIGPFNLILDK